MSVDYHVHTEFSDDSQEPMEKQVEQGIALGLKEICFTDHVDYGIKKDWEEGDIEWRGGDGVGLALEEKQPLANVDYPKYLEKLKATATRYGDKITVLKGLELGVQTITIQKYETLWEKYGRELDFALLSVHEIDNKELFVGDFQRGLTQREYNERYYQELYDVVQNYKHYAVLSHLDLIVRYDKAGRYPFVKVKDIIAAILETAIKDGKGIEINTSSWHYGLDDTMPSRDVLRLYKDLGGKIITIGSDAHSIKYLADHARDAEEILSNEIGFKAFYTFRGMEPEGHRFL